MDAGSNDQADRVAAAGRGDARAFGDLVEPLAPRLLLYVRWQGARSLGGDFDEEDALQLVLATVWRKLPALQYRGGGAFYRWMVSIADGVLADRRKYLAAARRPDLRRLGSGELDPRDPTTTISRRVARREDWARAEQALHALSADDRAVVEQHLLEGRSVREVAEALQIGKSTVWDRFDRAMTQLRGALGVAG